MKPAPSHVHPRAPGLGLLAAALVLCTALSASAMPGAGKVPRAIIEAQQDLPPYLVATPKIISQSVDQSDWSELGELAVRS